MALEAQLSQATISGLNMGCVYSIVGLVIAVVYNVSKIFDVSQGQYVMLGAMLVCFFQSLKFPLIFCLTLAIVIPLFVGLIIWRVLFYRSSEKYPALTLIMITFGVGMLIEGLAYVVLGTDTMIAPYYLRIRPVRIVGGTISPQALLVYAILLLMMLFLYILFHHTMLGKALRACHDRVLAARLMGINPPNMMYFAFVLAVCFGAVGGVIMVPLTAANYSMGMHLVIKGFLAALVGGISRFQGVIIGGIALGMSESFLAAFISSGYASIISLAIFVVALLFRPSGLLLPKQVRT